MRNRRPLPSDVRSQRELDNRTIVFVVLEISTDDTNVIAVFVDKQAAEQLCRTRNSGSKFYFCHVQEHELLDKYSVHHRIRPRK